MKRIIAAIYTLLFFVLSSANVLAQTDKLHESGVSLELAQSRKAAISNLKYNIDLDIPSDKSADINGSITISFALSQKQEIIIDFRESSDKIKAVKANGKKCQYTFENEHISIAEDLAKKGKNSIQIDFIAGNQSLNRNADYMYSLFVPDRARTAFPCFEQPDLKASFVLSLNIPEEWSAVSNTYVQSTKTKNGKSKIQFAPTEPLSTYLFAFAAGRFKHIEYPDGDRTIGAYYRETDPERIRQFNDIFQQIAASIHWLEDYTGIKYPFAKYDFVVLPGFQFGGMEHTGATFYNDNTLFLTQNPTPDEELRRASLIAHETAHMWFGDLVTMQWFNDVWTKEVFANYFAAEITAPQFPNINHNLNWQKSYVASAMSEDRTLGGTAIRQPLDNLRNAGLIYNNIIYCKAPVMMKKLVELMGKDNFRSGIQEYLKTYSYGNATWPDLVKIMSRHTQEDIEAFSDVWVNQKGMPTITMEVADGKFTATQTDPYFRGLVWPQRIDVQLTNGTDSKDITIDFAAGRESYTTDLGSGEWHIIPNVEGRGYGFITTDYNELQYWLSNWQKQEGATRQATLMTLHENWLNKKFTTEDWINALLSGLAHETDALTASTMVGYCEAPIWELEAEAREDVENKLVSLYSRVPLESCKLQLYRLLYRVGVSEDAVGEVFFAWDKSRRSFLNDNDYTNMSYQLMLRLPDSSDEIFMQQRRRITNPDRVRQFDFIGRATICDPEYQDSLFDSLLIPANRRIEPWTASVLSFLNHPMREEQSIKYIYPALEALTDVQRTGDIFFPANWCNALLASHRSPEAYGEVLRFLDAHPDYPQLLKNKILNAAYMLYRANNSK